TRPWFARTRRGGRIRDPRGDLAERAKRHIYLIARIEPAKAEAHRSSRKGAECSVRRRGAVQAAARHDVERLVENGNDVRGGKTGDVERNQPATSGRISWPVQREPRNVGRSQHEMPDEIAVVCSDGLDTDIAEKAHARGKAGNSCDIQRAAFMRIGQEFRLNL